MKKINVPARNEVDSKAQIIFDNLKSKLGMVPNMYATIGYSGEALDNYLAYSGNAGKSSFNTKEIEAIKLAVSEANGCEYCTSAHTTIAKMIGITEEETLQFRAGESSEERISILAKLGREITLNKGEVDQQYLDQFFNLGFDEKALIDLISVVIDISFTNYTHNLIGIPVDFPQAKSLAENKKVA